MFCFLQMKTEEQVNPSIFRQYTDVNYSNTHYKSVKKTGRTLIGLNVDYLNFKTLVLQYVLSCNHLSYEQTIHKSQRNFNWDL